MKFDPTLRYAKQIKAYSIGSTGQATRKTGTPCALPAIQLAYKKTMTSNWIATPLLGTKSM